MKNQNGIFAKYNKHGPPNNNSSDNNNNLPQEVQNLGDLLYIYIYIFPQFKPCTI
jgi:hypothetical protein